MQPFTIFQPLRLAARARHSAWVLAEPLRWIAQIVRINTAGLAAAHEIAFLSFLVIALSPIPASASLLIIARVQ